MKHFLILLTVAIVTLAIMFAIYNPDLLRDSWLWIVGLAGPVVGFIKKGIEYVKEVYKEVETKVKKQ